MPDRNQTLPDFRDPPVNETALSIQFAPVPKFGAQYFGLYWAKIRHEYTRSQALPPLPSATEEFEAGSRVPPQFGIQLINEPELRCWFWDDTGNRLVQLQHDRLIYNWRQIRGDENYPRYPSIRDALKVEWLRFSDFLEGEHLEKPKVNQCEVIYVNHIEYGKGWNGYGELNRVVAPWSGDSSGTFLPVPERVNMETHYLLPDRLGRLHISMQPVIRGRDTQEVLQIMLTARGAPKSSSIDDIFDWLDLGREWVVKGFADFTTDSMHKIWGRRS